MLLLRNEYLAAENRILRAQIKGRLLLSDAEKTTLAEIAHRFKRKALEELAAVAKPDTLLAWYRKLIANKFDGSKFRKSSGRPRVDEETERLVVRMAKENPGWGYDRIVGAMANLGHRLSDQTVGNILRRHDIPPAPKRKQTTSWKDFIRAHMAVLVATDCRWRWKKGPKQRWSGYFSLCPFPSWKGCSLRTARSGQGRAGVARRSEPFTARTVLRSSTRGKGVALNGPLKWPSRSPPLTNPDQCRARARGLHRGQWSGHAGIFRQGSVVEKAGLGFELPSKIIVIGRNGRKLESARDLEMTATA